MSAALLLAWISAALLLQVGIAVVVAFWRRQRRRIEVAASPVLPAAGAWEGWREFRVVRRVDEDPAQTLCSFHLEPKDGAPLLPFVPGQFLTVAVPIGGRTLTRCYSLSDGPNPKSYRISVKRVLAPPGRPELPAGACSNHLHDRLQVGDILKAKAPAGRFVVDGDPDVPVVLIAGGVGITPLLSMLRGGLLGAEKTRVVHLYVGVRQGSEHSFRTELAELARLHPTFHLNVVYSRPGPDDGAGRDHQHVGHVDVDLLRRTLPAGRHRFYVCGPPAMMASLLPALRQWGVGADDIHHEAFGPASASVPSRSEVSNASPSLTIMFRKSGRTLAWDGTDRNLLDFAERHGVSVDSGCRAGSCGSCEVKVLSGAVRYAQQPDHDVKPGHCLLCVGSPDSALELEA